MSRSKKASKNTVAELLLEVVTAICSFILPRLILTYFGSTYNGITSSIIQFIGCVALLKSGIGSVTRAALYKPLAEKNSKEISEVVNATAGFMKKIAVIFSVIVIVFAGIYPLLVSDEFSWLFSFSLVIILSLSTFFQYFFGLTYQMVLEADQRNYIISFVSIVSTVINTIVAAVLIKIGCSIHIVKLGSAIVFTIPPIFYNMYVTKIYKVDKSVLPNYNVISQRWDAFGHQVANFINTNTDIIVASVCLGVKEVSVYSIYYMIANAIQRAIKAFSTGTTAAFGNMLAKKESINLKHRFEQYEVMMFYISISVVTIGAILITPFVSVYTKGVSDVNYYRPFLGYLICVAIYFMCIKLPYEQMVYAAGEFKKTRNGAFVEAIINIVISVALVNIIGLNGIIIGTIIAIMYRTIRYHVFVSKNIVQRKVYKIGVKFLYSVLVFAGSFLVCSIFPLQNIDNFGKWIIYACPVTLVCAGIATLLGFFFFKKEMLGIISIIKTVVRRKK